MEVGNLGRRPVSLIRVTSFAEDAGVNLDNLDLFSPAPNDEAEPGVDFSSPLIYSTLPLTAPYFHDRSTDTVADVVDFYINGGMHDLPELDSPIRPLSVRGNDRENVIAMLNALVDPRIEAGTGPYAHPQPGAFFRIRC